MIRHSPTVLLLLLLGACGGKSLIETDVPPEAGGADNTATGGASHGHGPHYVEVGGAAPSGGAAATDMDLSGAAGQSGSELSSGGATLGCAAGAACVPPSCVGLAPTCGQSAAEDCCASPLVPGVPGATFYRSYDGVSPDYQRRASPAKVSTFRLDAYEITVGRFRQFVAAYSPSMIREGAGKNPNNPADPGWQSAWNASLEPDAAALTAALKCGTAHQTWTDTVGSDKAESLPINCLDWYEAAAFCIWDGGRLPTEAEWNYAAAGGEEQRVYPWGGDAPDCAHANFYGASDGNDFCTHPGLGGAERVGAESPLGDGRFGQTDLAGNVWELVQDVHAKAYPNPCSDCANLSGTSPRAVRGGGMFDGPGGLLVSFRSNDAAAEHSVEIGARCARAR